MQLQTENSFICINKINSLNILEHYLDDTLVYSEYYYSEQECVLAFYKYCFKYSLSVMIESEQIINDYSMD